ncbi:MAG TPA: hypothetical protein VE178_20805 [Silvibacterium sp.]|nr:hypothetical protein [Silvibacterium sp.]
MQHSHIVEYASALADDIGPRLTGSPNLAWTRDQLTAMGCVNGHLERLGRIRDGLATTEHVGEDDVAGHGGVYCAGDAVVPVDERAGERRFWDSSSPRTGWIMKAARTIQIRTFTSGCSPAT